MRPSILWLVFSAAIASTSTLPQIPDLKPEDFPYYRPKTEGAFIVQLKSDASLGKRFGDQASAHDRFHKRAALGLDYTIRTEFTNPSLFYGVSIQLNQNKTEAEVKATLDAIPEVIAVYPIHKIARPGPAQGKGNLTVTSGKSSPYSSGAWAPTDNNPKLPKIKGNADVSSALKMGDVDKLHTLGIKGKGIKIGIIDTGVDYTHPSLGRGFGPGYKVAGGYSFVEDGWTGDTEPVQSANPLATCYECGHGTHVSGQ